MFVRTRRGVRDPSLDSRDLTSTAPEVARAVSWGVEAVSWGVEAVSAGAVGHRGLTIAGWHARNPDRGRAGDDLDPAALPRDGGGSSRAVGIKSHAGAIAIADPTTS